jgi:sortase A
MQALGTRSSMRRGARVLSALLVIVGLLLLADAGLTLVWREPVTSLYARVQQDRLERRLTEFDRTAIGPIERRALAREASAQRRLELAARIAARRVHPGQPIARLRIARIGLSAVVVQGTASGDLSKGPGHYPKTPLPGERGTVGIAGHRTTFGAWFRHVDELRRGDQIRIAMPYGAFTYHVQRTRVVASDALWITRKVGFNQLVLSACHPLYSASKRIVIFARLVGARPRGATA